MNKKDYQYIRAYNAYRKEGKFNLMSSLDRARRENAPQDAVRYIKQNKRWLILSDVNNSDFLNFFTDYLN